MTIGYNGNEQQAAAAVASRMQGMSLSRFGLERPGRQLALLLLVGWSARLVLALLAEHPGLYDPNHYYILARNLVEGRGFVIDYIWQYHRPPADVTHPIDYWMPLAALYPAVSMKIFGGSLFAALLPSTIIGTSLSLLAWGIARAARLSPAAQLMAAGLVLFIPEFMLGSVRTDTPISYALWVGLAFLCFGEGMRKRPQLLVGTGVFTGLAWLTRNDGLLLLPTLVIGIGIWWRFGGQPLRWRWLGMMFLATAVVMLPWFWRNVQVFGSVFPTDFRRTIFITHFNEQYAYLGEYSLNHYFAWGWRNILGNIAFHALSNVKQTYTRMDIALPVFVVLGLGGLILRRERNRLLPLATPLVFWVILYFFNTVVAPFHSMGGSFKKSQLALIPWLAMPAAWALETYVRPRRAAYIMAAIIVVFMAMNGVEFVRQEMKFIRTRTGPYPELRDTLNELGDANGDGRITVMGEVPWTLHTYGFYALITPYDDRDNIIAAARDYQVDYLILPTDRWALDAISSGEETDPRLPIIATSAHFKIAAVTEAAEP